jgi:hypothetical protein
MVKVETKDFCIGLFIGTCNNNISVQTVMCSYFQALGKLNELNEEHKLQEYSCKCAHYNQDNVGD